MRADIRNSIPDCTACVIVGRGGRVGANTIGPSSGIDSRTGVDADSDSGRNPISDWTFDEAGRDVGVLTPESTVPVRQFLADSVAMVSSGVVRTETAVGLATGAKATASSPRLVWVLLDSVALAGTSLCCEPLPMPLRSSHRSTKANTPPMMSTDRGNPWGVAEAGAGDAIDV